MILKEFFNASYFEWNISWLFYIKLDCKLLSPNEFKSIPPKDTSCYEVAFQRSENFPWVFLTIVFLSPFIPDYRALRSREISSIGIAFSCTISKLSSKNPTVVPIWSTYWTIWSYFKPFFHSSGTNHDNLFPGLRILQTNLKICSVIKEKIIIFCKFRGSPECYNSWGVLHELHLFLEIFPRYIFIQF